eukprot:5360486-Prymnesium_polylepis.1
MASNKKAHAEVTPHTRCHRVPRERPPGETWQLGRAGPPGRSAPGVVLPGPRHDPPSNQVA